jgi:hypothetical protein
MSNNSHEVSLDQAKEMTHAYQNAPNFQGLTVSGMIDKDSYLQVVNQPNCVNVRTYFALNSDMKLTIVVVGVDANGEDITDGVLLNKALLCPENCPQISPLLISVI